MKSTEILLEVAKEEGEKELEVLLVKAYGILEKAAPRIALEAEDAPGKAIGGVLMLALPAFKAVIEKLADLNKDGKIG